MKGFLTKISTLLLLTPTIATAGWQVATPQNTMTTSSNAPFFQAGMQQNSTFSSSGNSAFNQDSSLGNPAAIYAISVSGSLKENIERIMDRYHWKVVWKAPYDYNFDGRVTGSSLPNVIEKLLQPFPLQAVMYMSNRTMAIVPRKA
jgi:hypothetical protein